MNDTQNTGPGETGSTDPGAAEAPYGSQPLPAGEGVDKFGAPHDYAYHPTKAEIAEQRQAGPSDAGKAGAGDMTPVARPSEEEADDPA